MFRFFFTKRENIFFLSLSISFAKGGAFLVVKEIIELTNALRLGRSSYEYDHHR